MTARIIAPGLTKLRRDLRSIDKELGKEADRHIRQTAAKVRADARANAPEVSGKLKRSIRYSLTRGGASIYSNEIYAPVIEYGGEISPRGTPISITGQRYMDKALDDNTEFLDEELARLLDVIADRFGFVG